ncbi:MAG TPA: serine hydrolase domain-containing protein [Gemmatimonadales bacterium]
MILATRRPLLAAAAALVLAAPLAAQSPQARPSMEETQRIIDSLANDAVNEGRFSSVSVGVVRGRDTVLLAAYGLADREGQLPAGPDVAYRLASITKQFTAALVLQLADEGRLSLGDSVGKWLPQVPPAWRGVTVAQLLNHTSGIPSYTALGPAWMQRWGEDMEPDTIIALTFGKPMDFEPGAKFRYDNTGYVILGRIVELAMGKSYEEAVQERLAGPLGLEGLSYCPSRPTAATDARPYERAPGGLFMPAPYLSMTQPYAAGALCATAHDLVRWNAALHGGRVVSDSLYWRMVTPEGAARASRYAFGLSRDTVAGHEAITHNGGINGGSTEGWYFPDDSTSIVALANTGNGGALAKLVRQMARAVYGVPLVQPPTTIPLTATERAMYVGRYELSMGERKLPLEVRESGEGLTAQPAGQPAYPIIQVAPRTFVLADDDAIRLVFTTEGGRATQVVLEQGGARIVGPRVESAGTPR